MAAPPSDGSSERERAGQRRPEDRSPSAAARFSQALEEPSEDLCPPGSVIFSSRHAPRERISTVINCLITGNRVGGSGPQPCLGDLDNDRDVELSYLAQRLARYGTTSGTGAEDGDLNCDTDVDLGDLAQLLAAYGTACK